MEKTQSIEEFYKTKLDWIPSDLQRGIGHFNIFKLDDFVGQHSKPIPYSRKDYYKISLIIGGSKVFYADKVVEIKQRALFFANPQIPYTWESVHKQQTGYFCVFTPSFFHHFGNLKNYEVFQPNGTFVFELNEPEAGAIERVFLKMFEALDSSYVHKYDLLRNLVFDILHQATKMRPAAKLEEGNGNASERMAALFLELLERQYPIEDPRQKIALRSPSDFATQLSVHTSHLNRAVKQITGKTTSGLIAERVLLEAKILLKYTQWNISEIAYALGFTEASHFNNFFRRQVNINPSQYRLARIS